MRKLKIALGVLVVLCSSSRLEGAFVKGKTAYVLSERSMYVFDVSDPLKPELRGSIAFGYPPEGVVVYGDVAYVADGKWGLCLVNVKNPARPRISGRVKTDFARAVEVMGGYAYVADRGSGLAVVEVKNARRPRLVARCKTPGFAWDVAVKPGIAAIADCEYGLRFIDISNPKRPVEVGHWDAYDETGKPQEMRWALGVDLEGDRAYGAFQRGGLKIIDISTPDRPRFLGHAYLGFTQAREVEVKGNLAYVMISGSVFAVDVSDPANPKIEGRFKTDSPAYGMFLWNGYIVSQAGMLDVRDPSKMRMVSLFQGLILRDRQTTSY